MLYSNILECLSKHDEEIKKGKKKKRINDKILHLRDPEWTGIRHGNFNGKKKLNKNSRGNVYIQHYEYTQCEM